MERLLIFVEGDLNAENSLTRGAARRSIDSRASMGKELSWKGRGYDKKFPDKLGR